MSDERPPISGLDGRLAEIDRRLSSIQTGLLDPERPRPEGGTQAPPLAPAPPPAPLPPAPPPPAPAPPTTPAELLAELRFLAAAHEQVLQSTRELLAAYERALAKVHSVQPGGTVREFSVSAGPFSSTDALRGFERTLSRIPEVREVAVRGYEGGDRAIFDVQLFGSKS